MLGTINIRQPKNCCNYPKIRIMWFYHRVMSPKDADRMAISVAPDQTPSYNTGIHTKPLYEPPRDKTNKMTVRPAKTQISLGIRPV